MMWVDPRWSAFRPFTYHLVSNPRWADAEGRQILMSVVFDHLREEVGFRADPNDCEEHGRELFARAAAGEFGPVASYTE